MTLSMMQANFLSSKIILHSIISTKKMIVYSAHLVEIYKVIMVLYMDLKNSFCSYTLLRPKRYGLDYLFFPLDNK